MKHLTFRAFSRDLFADYNSCLSYISNYPKENCSEFPEYFSTRTKRALANMKWISITSPEQLFMYIKCTNTNGSFMLPYFPGIGEKGMNQIWKFAVDNGLTTNKRCKYERFSELPDLSRLVKGMSVSEKECFKLTKLSEQHPVIRAFKLYCDQRTPILSILTNHCTYNFKIDLLRSDSEQIRDVVYKCLKLFHF